MSIAAPQLLARNGRPTKFTPERIQQIKNLVERGKSRDEIAELLDVTVGSLQVTCSRLGISLRRVFLDNGVGLRRGGEQRHYGPRHSFNGSTSSQLPTGRHLRDLSPVGQTQTTTQYQEQTELQEADSMANFTIRVQYKGEARATELLLTNSMIAQLALEADFRHVRIDELVSGLIITTMKKGLLQLVLDPQSG
jgi:hypothetical protein